MASPLAPPALRGPCGAGVAPARGWLDRPHAARRRGLSLPRPPWHLWGGGGGGGLLACVGGAAVRPPSPRALIWAWGHFALPKSSGAQFGCSSLRGPEGGGWPHT